MYIDKKSWNDQAKQHLVVYTTETSGFGKA